MYKVYPPSNYRCSKRISLKQFFENYGEMYRNIPKNNNGKMPEDKRFEAILGERKIFDSHKLQELNQLYRYCTILV